MHVDPGVKTVRVYNRALRTSDAISAFLSESGPTTP